MANEQEPVTITNSVEVNADTEKLKTTPQTCVTIPAQDGGRGTERRPENDGGRGTERRPENDGVDR